MKNQGRLKSLAHKLNLASLLFSSIISMSPETVIAETRPDWAREFYGQVTFRLLDDPVYRDKYVILNGILEEMNSTKRLLTEKQQTLSAKNSTKQQKVNLLATTQTSLAAKTSKLKSNNDELKLKESQITGAGSAILAATSMIKIKDNELITYANVLKPFKDELANARTALAERQAIYDSALQACRDHAAGTACTDAPAVIVAKHHLARAKERIQYLTEQIAHYDQLVTDATHAKQSAQTTMSTERTKKDQAIARMAAINTENANLTNDISTLIQTLGTLSNELDKLSGEITVLSSDVGRLSSIVAQQEVGFTNEQNHFDKLEIQLIEEILSANRIGYSNSRSHGSQDGIEVARRTGDGLGEQHGLSQGALKGQQDGRSREFTRGAAEGETIGQQEGAKAGYEQGVSEGQTEGFRMAGAQEGQASGLVKAEASNASQVGSREGSQSGLQAAQRDGLARGSQIGEAQAIRDAESVPLSPSIIRGPFAGTFQSQVRLPRFPGATGQYRNNELGNARSIIRQAYISGYSIGYDAAAAETYNANIGAIYQAAYTRFYNLSYQSTVSREYQDSFRQGREIQYQTSYNREYRVQHQQTFWVAKEDARKNPDRRNSVFTNAFKTTETSAYDRRFGEIREDHRQQNHGNVFNQNIEAETNKARQIRKAQVLSIYAQFPIIKFESSSILDNGIRGIAAGDSVYQPGEEVSLNNVLVNYGSKEATGLKLTTSTGESFNLPSIPGRSVITLQGAGKSNISATAPEGSQETLEFSLIGQLDSGEQTIQGRHYANLAEKLIAKSTHKKTVQFPFQVSELRSNSPLVLGETANIKVSMFNKSSRAYEGKIDLELETSLGRGIVAKDFNTVSHIGHTLSAQDAQIQVKDSNLLYTDVDFSIAIRQNGVLLGYATRSGRDYLRVAYVARPNMPVAVFNSSTAAAREQIKDLAASLGGADRISVLDLSASDRYQDILDRDMKGKTLLVLDNGSQHVSEKLKEAVQTQATFIVMLQDRDGKSGLRKLISSLDSSLLVSAVHLTNDGHRSYVYSTNPVIAGSTKQKVSIVETSLNDLEDTLKLQAILKLTTLELMAKLNSEMTRENYVNPNASLKLLVKTIALRNIEEAVTLDDLYDKSKGIRRFLFWKLRDKSILARVQKDDTLIIGALRNALKSGLLATALIAKAIQEATMKILEGDVDQPEALNKMRKAYKRELKDLVQGADKLLKAALQ